MSEKLEDFYSKVGTDPIYTNAARLRGQTPEAASKIEAGTQASSAWASNGDKFWGISQSRPSLPPGCYMVGVSQETGPFLMTHELNTDQLLDLPGSKSDAVVKEIEDFIKLKPAFTERGFLHKRGVLLWGPPGSGKTSTLHMLMKLIINEKGGIAVILRDPNSSTIGLKLIRKIEPERQIIGIFEDIDGLVQTFGVEGYLSLLDGEAQVDNVIFVATTNFPERLDKRFTDRPSRFDTIEYVGMPSAAAREFYFLNKEPKMDKKTLKALVEGTENLSVAHLREAIILTQCFGLPAQDTISRLNVGKKRKLNSEAKNPEGEKVSTGFAPNKEERTLPADLDTLLDLADAGDEVADAVVDRYYATEHELDQEEEEATSASYTQLD